MKILKSKYLFIAVFSVLLWSCSNESVEPVVTQAEIVYEEVSLDDISADEEKAAQNWLRINEGKGGHLIDRHWNKTDNYLKQRGLEFASTFSTKEIGSEAKLSALIKKNYTAIVKANKARLTAVGSTVTADFSSTKAVGHGFAEGSGTLYSTKKYKVVVRRISAKDIIVLTGFPTP